MFDIVTKPTTLFQFCSPLREHPSLSAPELMNEPIIIFNAWRSYTLDYYTDCTETIDEVNSDKSVSIMTHDSILDSRKWLFFLFELRD